MTHGESAVLEALCGVGAELSACALCVGSDFGDYPRSMRKILGHKLPRFTAAERKLLIG